MSAVFLSLLGVAASAALYFTADAIERNGRLLLGSLESVRTAEHLQVSILALSRARQMFDSEPIGAPVAARKAVEEARGALDAFDTHVSSEKERRLVERVRRDVTGYLQSSPADPQDVRTDRLQTALVTTEELINLNVAQAEEIRARNIRVDQLGKVMAVGLALALVMGNLLFVIWLQASVDRPLASLRRSLSRFMGGTREERLPVQGPEELRQIAAEFNELADSLSRRDRLQLEFLAGVAHDLRGPLNVLKLSAQSMVAAPALPPPEIIRASLKRVSVQVDHLARMIDDLLDRTRIEAGNLELQLDVCDLRPMVAEVADIHRLASDKHHLEVSVPSEPVLVRGDPTRLVQVLTNLVSNAIKYSPEGGAVRIILEVGEGKALLAVTDEGIGIAPEDREHVFEPFRRSTRDAAMKIPGVGLGLSVSRRLVQAHGGEIEVEARTGGGSLFRVRLPLVRADLAARGNGSAQPDAEPFESPPRTD